MNYRIYNAFQSFKVSTCQSFKFENGKVSKFQSFRVSTFQSFEISKFQSFKLSKIQSFIVRESTISKKSDTRVSNETRFETLIFAQILWFNMICDFCVSLSILAINKASEGPNLVEVWTVPNMFKII